MARRSSAPKKFKPNKVQRGGSKRNQAAGEAAPPPKAADDTVQQMPSDLPQPFEEASAPATLKRDTEKTSNAAESGIKMLTQESGAQFDIKSTTSSELCPGTPVRENLSPRQSDISTLGSQTESCDGGGCSSDDDRSSVQESQARDDTTCAEDSAEQALHFPATSKETATVAPSSPAALPAALLAPAVPALSSADCSGDNQDNITDAADSTKRPSQLPAISKDHSPVAPTPAAALPAISSAAVSPASPQDSTADNEVLDEAFCTTELHQEGLSSDANKCPAGMSPTLPITQSKEQQLKAHSDAHIDFPPVALTPPMGSTTTSQAQDKATEAAEDWPGGLTGWALLLCGRLQAKTPTAVRPLVDVAVAAAVELLAATAALSAICS